VRDRTHEDRDCSGDHSGPPEREHHFVTSRRRELSPRRGDERLLSMLACGDHDADDAADHHRDARRNDQDPARHEAKIRAPSERRPEARARVEVYGQSVGARRGQADGCGGLQLQALEPVGASDRALPDLDDAVWWQVGGERDVCEAASLMEGLPDHRAEFLLVL
jgi:hypothetical protein